MVIVAWRDLANPRAGGSELLVDQLAAGMVARGNDVTLLCGGDIGERPYRVVRSGGDYSQFLLAPLAFRRRIPHCDVVVEVCNGLPYLTPLWCDRPVVCLVNHVHTALWSMRYPPPVSTIGRFAERVVMPKVHADSLFITVSPSSALELAGIGVRPDRIRLLYNGVEPPPPYTPRSPTPLFVALGRLADYKRLDLLLALWERVRPVTGGQLVIAGDGPDRERLERLAGNDVTFTGRISEADKHELLCSAWLLLHPAVMEGWGIVVAEAAARGTPTVGFDVPGLRDSVVNGRTGLLATTEGRFAGAWASLALNHTHRAALGHQAHLFADQLRWSTAVDRFSAVIDEASTSVECATPASA
ncbi:glycosyltransferase family 4 protein [Amycolatopsis sp. H20-H5]|uniref:glycosyltransferase family 4 protein n=1 Tax=Amycolatopsis sp. H20-H5 TaxID=3046309 RepID=UPI002DBE17DB|nr:glycosyltransferase family 4 protein [Amycolatopsis sp. H20-H5]MEC3980080.1 glycosyltransferase family 4 protein [Amycolatopsis sp. H20-H5]